jgi:hypothetical protein
MGRPRKIVKEDDIVDKITDKTSLLDIIADAVQAGCGIPGCKGKFHYPEAQLIVNRLRNAGYLKEV